MRGAAERPPPLVAESCDTRQPSHVVAPGDGGIGVERGVPRSLAPPAVSSTDGPGSALDPGPAPDNRSFRGERMAGSPAGHPL
jgi:hypothetical protein